MTAPERPEALEPLSAVDHAWLRMDQPDNLMIINGCLVLDRNLDREGLKAILEKRLLPIRRFRQRVLYDKGVPHWEPDPGFDLDAHVLERDLPAPGDDASLRAVVSELMSQPLGLDRPLWRFHILHGYKDGGSVLMGRLHHSIGDGMALLLVLLSLTDRTVGTAQGDDVPEDLENPFIDLFRQSPRGAEAAKELARQIMPDGMRLLEQSAEAFKAMGPVVTSLVSTGAFARLVGRPSDPKTIFKGPLGVAKRVAWSEPILVSDVKAVGKALGGTINDVLISAMTGGLRRYLDRHGQRAHGLSFRAAMPVNLRSIDRMSELGNRFGLIFLSLPVGIDDAVERLAELRRRALALKRSAEPVVVYAILRLLGLVPLAVQNGVVKIFGTKATAVMTNVPGPREELYLAGRAIRELFFWVPQSGRLGLGISIMSYAGHVRLGLASDAGLVPDPEVVVEGFHEELEELQARARGG
ncbi:MAG TPA: wax ester/triacylglycerol synthase family O-acyltransferase [Thermoanaerobaculia bacterium]|nr:wax ester/triacylglycerol synthase family O-acyltransferase [Thermoanaerobaculia bacterium]